MIVKPKELRDMYKKVEPYLVEISNNQQPILNNEAPQEIQELYQEYLEENKKWREKTRAFRELLYKQEE
ncbi:hypothetical protein [Lysinibacillus piscis]|nr:hypothetical protein [Lysinibacillus sp. KH24]